MVCTVKALTSSGVSSGDQGGKGKKGGEKGKTDSPPSLKKTEKNVEPEKPKETSEDSRGTSSTTTADGDQAKEVAQPAKELMMEAASLLKSLRLPSLKSMRISSLEERAVDGLFLMRSHQRLENGIWSQGMGSGNRSQGRVGSGTYIFEASSMDWHPAIGITGSAHLCHWVSWRRLAMQ